MQARRTLKKAKVAARAKVQHMSAAKKRTVIHKKTVHKALLHHARKAVHHSTHPKSAAVAADHGTKAHHRGVGRPRHH